jgi:hypothetical protein
MPGDSSGTPRTDTGKGPNAWSHDNSAFGIQDLVGNVWEWIDQLKLEEGQIITTLDNNPDILESAWQHHNAFYDSTSETGGTSILNNQVTNRLGALNDSQNTGNSNYADFKSLTKDANYTPVELLRQLLLETESSNNVNGRLYTRNFGERFPRRGGGWYNGSIAGLGALSFNNSRSYSGNSVGFRPAFFV